VDVKVMKQRILNLLIAVFTLVLLSGCHYDFPEGTKTTVHTYEEVTAYIQSYLNRDDVYVDTMTISGKDGYDRKYTHYYARVDDIDFVISSQVLCYGDSTGEFCEKRYGLHNNYNYKKIKALMQTTNQYPNIRLRSETNPYLHIYNISYFYYQLPITNEDDLIRAFNDSKNMYNWIIQAYPNPRFCVIMSVENHTRRIYVCAHQDDSDRPEKAFNQASYDETIAEYHEYFS
jgi:hypothetical protein